MSGDLDPVDALRALIRDNQAAVQQLRESAIPHHIGMAAACRALSLELPRVLSQQLEVDFANGAFAAQWRASRAAAAAAPGDLDTDLVALGHLVRERVDALVRQIAARGKAWVAETYRLQGQADALEAQTGRIGRLLPPDAEFVAAAEAPAAPPNAAAAEQHAAPVGATREP